MAGPEATGFHERPGTPPLRDCAVGAAAALLFGAALWVDLVAPGGYGGFLYVVPFLVVAAGLPRSPALAAAGLTVLVSAAGLLLSPPGLAAVVAATAGGASWVLAVGAPAALALVGRAASWLLVAGCAVALDGARARAGPAPPGDRYRVLLREHEAAALVIDPEGGCIVDANPAAARFFWASPDDLRAMRVTDLAGAAGDADRRPLLGATEGQRAPQRFAFRHESGEDRYVEVVSIPVTAEGRSLLYSTVFDVTEAHRAGHAILGTAARDRALLDGLPGGMVLFGAVAGTDGRPDDVRILDLNAAGGALIGRTRGEAVGRTLRELFGEAVPPWFDAVVRVAETGRPGTVPFEGLDGGPGVAVRLYRPGAGLVAGLALEADGAEGDAAPPVSGAAFSPALRLAGLELREPLWTILSFTELLVHRLGHDLDPGDREVLDYILAVGGRMERQIDALGRDDRAGTPPAPPGPADGPNPPPDEPPPPEPSR